MGRGTLKLGRLFVERFNRHNFFPRGTSSNIGIAKLGRRTWDISCAAWMRNKSCAVPLSVTGIPMFASTPVAGGARQAMVNAFAQMVFEFDDNVEDRKLANRQFVAPLVGLARWFFSRGTPRCSVIVRQPHVSCQSPVGFDKRRSVRKCISWFGAATRFHFVEPRTMSVHVL